MKRYSVQIRKNSNWDLNAKSYFDFIDENDLSIFCYRLSAISQKEIKAESSIIGSTKYFNPANADYFLT